jgi:hypothetical protein
MIGAITCIVSCVTQNLDGRCHQIFSCSWECFSRDTPPPVEETHIQSYIALASNQALKKAKSANSVTDNFETRQIVPPIDLEVIIKFFKCVAACLIKYIPVDSFCLGAFLLCTKRIVILFDCALSLSVFVAKQFQANVDHSESKK